MANPDHFYDPDNWEYTYPWSMIHEFAEDDADLAPGEVKRVETLIRGPDKFVARVIVTRDEAGDWDKVETRVFDTEEEAKAASCPMPVESD